MQKESALQQHVACAHVHTAGVNKIALRALTVFKNYFKPLPNYVNASTFHTKIC